ncbi:MAG: hypothetical protein O3A93_13040 [Chloroflexi bacterium]|nr:hypothetical protein [Chloroflexota bacterium]MDA1272161.1 hypothetical protein [Chloroflexota bacterium]
MTTNNLAEAKLLEWAENALKQMEDAAVDLEDAQRAFETAKANLDAIQKAIEYGRSLVHPDAPDIPLSKIAEASSHNEALVIMARHGDGWVKTADAADLIKASGRSKAKRRSLYSNLYHLMSNSEDWEPGKQGQGRFKFIGDSRLSHEPIGVSQDYEYDPLELDNAKANAYN